MVLSRISTLSLQTQEAWTRSAVVQPPIPFLLPFFFWRASRRGVFAARHGTCSCGRGTMETSRGRHSLAGGREDTAPRPGMVWIQLCPTPEHLEARFPGGAASRAEWPTPAPPQGETLPRCSPKTDQRSPSDSFGEKRLQLEGCS